MYLDFLLLIWKERLGLHWCIANSISLGEFHGLIQVMRLTGFREKSCISTCFLVWKSTTKKSSSSFCGKRIMSRKKNYSDFLCVAHSFGFISVHKKLPDIADKEDFHIFYKRGTDEDFLLQVTTKILFSWNFYGSVALLQINWAG